MGKKNTTILEEKRAIFIPESEFSYIHVSVSMWFAFLLLNSGVGSLLPGMKTLGIIFGIIHTQRSQNGRFS